MKLLQIAKMHEGYTEDPPNSNQTKFGEWFGLNGVSWCGIFVSWCYYQAGTPLPAIGFEKGFAGCQTAVQYFTQHKLLTNKPVPGDIVFFDWNGDGRFDHTGIFYQQIDNTKFISIEGNTSFGNNSNGGKVMSRIRKFNKQTIFVHPII